MRSPVRALAIASLAAAFASRAGAQVAPPSSLIPEEALLAVRIAPPSGSSPLFGAHASLLGFAFMSAELPPLDGIDLGRPWYAFLTGGEPGRRGPFLVLPLADAKLFETSLLRLPPGTGFRLAGGHALVGSEPLPRGGGTDLLDPSRGTFGARARLGRLLRAFEGELEELFLRGRLEPGPEGPVDPETRETIVDLEALRERLRPEIEKNLALLRECDLFELAIEEEPSFARWTIRMSFDPRGEVGRFLTRQEPTRPEILERVDTSAPVVYWARLRSSEAAEGIRSLLASTPRSFGLGVHLDFVNRILSEDSEAAAAVRLVPDGVELEAVYDLPATPAGSVRESLAAPGATGPGMKQDLERDVARLGRLPVDRLRLSLVDPGDPGLNPVLDELEIHYAWDERRVLMTMSGAREALGESRGLDRLARLAAGERARVPQAAKKLLERLPDRLVVLGWVDGSSLLRASAGEGGASGSPSGAFYATVAGSRLELGGLWNLELQARQVSDIQALAREAESHYENGNRAYRGAGVSQDFEQAERWFRKAARMGHAGAQNMLGIFHERGHAVPKDDLNAARWYRRAAEAGDASGAHNLALFYENGRGVRKDLAVAAHWYRVAAERDHTQAQFRLAELYEEGAGVERSLSEAARLYRLAAEKGDRRAQYSLGLAYLFGKGVARDEAEAARWLRKSAEQGYMWGQRELAFAYQEGRGVPPDDRQAVLWHEKAAEQGDPYSLSELAKRYEAGETVEQDIEKAVSLYEKAAEKEHVPAYFELGRLYESGKGVPQDWAMAAEWWKKAADQGDDRSKIALGRLYVTGSGVAREVEKGLELIRSITGREEPNAWMVLGMIYEEGLGVGQDASAAAVYYRKAAEVGHPWAQLRLGKLYALGSGVDRDPVQAYLWTSLAAREPRLRAESLVKALSRTMTPDQIRQAEELLESWRPKPVTENQLEGAAPR